MDSGRHSRAPQLRIQSWCRAVRRSMDWGRHSRPVQLSIQSHRRAESCPMQKKKNIHHHIKLVVHAESTKCRRNQKLIAQFSYTLRDERFEPN
jgi:hypothetical protein